MLTFAFMHHPCLDCILFGIPSLHLFTSLMFFYFLVHTQCYDVGCFSSDAKYYLHLGMIYKPTQLLYVYTFSYHSTPLTLRLSTNADFTWVHTTYSTTNKTTNPLGPKVCAIDIVQFRGFSLCNAIPMIANTIASHSEVEVLSISYHAWA